MALGIVGGLLGGFLAGLLTGGNDYMTGINISSIVVAVIGAVIAVFGYNFFQSRSGSVGAASDGAPNPPSKGPAFGPVSSRRRVGGCLIAREPPDFDRDTTTRIG